MTLTVSAAHSLPLLFAGREFENPDDLSDRCIVFGFAVVAKIN